MEPSIELLWQLNYEYNTRLSRARTTIDLVERLVAERGAPRESPLRATLTYLHTQLTHFQQAHRHWRYTFFYESPASKRVVQSDAAVRAAFSQFQHLHADQQATLAQMWASFSDLPRPDTRLTRVSTGDLWPLVHSAVSDLIEFDAYVEQLAAE
ncbi:MAG: hypothetical protein GYB67_07950 [Chloroflexi bacterium]|nr:hypothetical protein [Chloroflexota bacterium]